MQHLLQSPKAGGEGTQGCRGAEEVAGDTTDAWFRAKADSAEAAGASPRLPLKVLPAQGHFMPALPSSLHPSFLAPAWSLPKAGCPLPSRHSHSSR